jgi:class 3 adenylate cyclase
LCVRNNEAVVVARGGVVSKYIGDCVMAVFGLTPGDRMATRQAVMAALEMRADLYEYNEEARNPVNLDIHIGGNSGVVIAGEIGGAVRREFTVMGDTVGLAGRLEDAPDRGQIFVGFDALSAHYSPEALTQLLNRCFGTLEAVVRGYGGVVDKYIGERLMALFGVPNAIENAPRQASP